MRKEGNSGSVLISAVLEPVKRSLANGVLKQDLLDV